MPSFTSGQTTSSRHTCCVLSRKVVNWLSEVLVTGTNFPPIHSKNSFWSFRHARRFIHPNGGAIILPGPGKRSCCIPNSILGVWNSGKIASDSCSKHRLQKIYPLGGGI